MPQLAIETVKRQARAGPMAEAIKDLLASSPEAMDRYADPYGGIVSPHVPRLCTSGLSCLFEGASGAQWVGLGPAPERIDY